MSKDHHIAEILESHADLAAKKRTPEGWEEARAYTALHRAKMDLDEFAARYFEKYPDYPPDFFAPSHSYIWREVRKATAPDGYITKLEKRHKELLFVTLLPHHLSFRKAEQNPDLFFVPVHLQDLRENIKGRRLGPLYYRIELSPNDVTHVHLITGSKARGWSGHIVDVYSLEGLIRYLKKPLLPWNLKNFLRYLIAKRRYGRVYPHSGVFKK